MKVRIVAGWGPFNITTHGMINRTITMTYIVCVAALSIRLNNGLVHQSWFSIEE